MNLDDAMIAKLLSTYGAPMTATNATLARNFFANNPEIAEKRAMGLRGSGIDDNSDVFGPQLEKFIAQTDLPPRNAAETYSAPTQEQAAPAAKAPVRQASPSRQGNYGPATDTATKQGKDYGPGTEPQDGDWWKWLLAAAGLTATKTGGVGGTAAPNAPRSGPPAVVQPPEATFVGRMGPEIARNSPYTAGYLKGPNGESTSPQLANPYNRNQVTNVPKLEDNISDLSRVPVNEPPPTKVTGDPGLEAEAKKRQLQAEIDAENAKVAAEDADKKRMLDAIEERKRRQQNTRSLSDAAKRSLGRK